MIKSILNSFSISKGIEIYRSFLSWNNFPIVDTGLNCKSDANGWEFTSQYQQSIIHQLQQRNTKATKHESILLSRNFLVGQTVITFHCFISYRNLLIFFRRFWNIVKRKNGTISLILKEQKNEKYWLNEWYKFYIVQKPILWM